MVRVAQDIVNVAGGCKTRRESLKETGRRKINIFAGLSIATNSSRVSALPGGWGADEIRKSDWLKRFEAMRCILSSSCGLQGAQWRRKCELLFVAPKTTHRHV